MSHRLSRRMKIRKDKKRLSKKKMMKRELILMTPTKLTRSTKFIMKILRSFTPRSLMNSLIYNQSLKKNYRMLKSKHKRILLMLRERKKKLKKRCRRTLMQRMLILKSANKLLPSLVRDTRRAKNFFKRPDQIKLCLQMLASPQSSLLNCRKFRRSLNNFRRITTKRKEAL